MAKTYTAHHLPHMTRRILSVYASASPEVRSQGADWYAEAWRVSCRLARKHGVTPRQAAGVIAALSPMCHWSENVRRADLLLAGSLSGSLGKDKAERIVAGERPLDVLGGNKVRAFYRAIVERGGDSVVIDRHAHDIAVGAVTDDASRKTLERAGQYALFAEAYRRAADRVGIPAAEMQAVTWTQHRLTDAVQSKANSYRG